MSKASEMARRVARKFQERKAGAQGFEEWVDITDPRRAFDAARREAEYEYGSRGYTGSIAEKGGFQVVSRTPLSKSQINDMMQSGRYSITNNDKWGDAFAAPYAEERVVTEKEYTVRVPAKSRQEALALGKKAIAEKGRTRKGATVSVKLQEVFKTKEAGNPEVSVDRLSEKPATFVVNRFGEKTPARNLAEAKRFAAQALSGSPVGGTVEIVRTQRLALVQKTGEPTRLAEWEVRGIRQQVQVSNKIKGWAFWGMASS